MLNFSSLERLRKKGFEPVTKLLENVGGWPLVCNDCKWNEYEFSWQKVAKYYAGFFGEYSLFSISIDSLPNNSTIKVLTASIQIKNNLFKIF